MLCSCYHPLYVYIEYTCQPKVNNRANIKKKHPTVITVIQRQKGALNGLAAEIHPFAFPRHISLTASFTNAS